LLYSRRHLNITEEINYEAVTVDTKRERTRE
jgi:hypothetical protein